MQLTIKTTITFFLVIGIIWTLLPWGFGVHNYTKSRGGYLKIIARGYWFLLLVSHLLLIYLLWFDTFNYSVLCLLIGAHVIFLMLFGRDLGTN